MTAAWSARARGMAIALALVLAVFAVYWPGLGGGFVFDDSQNLLENPAIRVGHGGGGTWLGAAFSSPASDLQRPLAMLSFAANHYFTGYDSRAMKLTNIAIHACNALLALLLSWRLCRRAAPAGPSFRVGVFTAAAWALHPINLMAVLYVVQRMESLSHSFVLLGLIFYCAGRERQLQGRHGWHWIVTALLVFPALGLLAKESAALLPLYAFVLEAVLYRFESRDGRRHRGLLATFLFALVLPALVGGGWLLWRAFAKGIFSGRAFTPWERLLTEARVLTDYLHWTLLPNLRTLGLYHDDYVVSHGLLQPASTLPALLVLGALLALAWKLRRSRPLSSIGIGWFLCAHSLTATIVPLELVFEHRNYFASLGIMLALADLLLVLPGTAKRRWLGTAVAATFVGLLALITTLRAEEWSDPLRFARSEAAKHPHSPRSTYERARMLVIASNYDPRSPYFRPAEAAIEQAMAVPASGALPAQAMLMFSARAGLPLQPAWWKLLQEKVALHPGAPETQLSLIALTRCQADHGCKFDPDDMLATFEAALRPGDDAGILSIFGNYALNVVGDHELAFRLWKEAARLDPHNAQYQANLAVLAIRKQRYADAEQAIAALRGLGHFGQYAAEAGRLQALLETRRREEEAHTPP